MAKIGIDSCPTCCLHIGRYVPQASTGISPFELLYGRDVRGPLDVLKESWEAESKEGESVLSYVLLMRERLGAMTELVQTKLGEAHKSQKQWYDRTARSRQFTVGDEVLVLLPTSTKRLLAQWQGPYQVTRRVSKVNYEVDMKDKNKRKRVFHVNMLKPFYAPETEGYFYGRGLWGPE